MGESRLLCRPHGADWGPGCFRLRARTLADPEGGGVHPLWTQGATCLSPSGPLRTALWSPVSARRHGHTCAHLAHTHHTHHLDMQHMHTGHTPRATACMCTRMCTPHATLAYTPHTQCTRMHTSHADTHHTRMRGLWGLAEATLLVHASGVFRLKADQTGRALCSCDPRAKGGPWISETAKGPKRQGWGRRRRAPATRKRTRR